MNLRLRPWILTLLLLPRLAAADVAGDPSDPETERASFRVAPGFDVTLFASEREGVVKPIQIRFDPDGRLWVVGSTVYPQIRPGQPAEDKVLVLEDRDGDGRADRSTVFAEGLMIPSGIEWGHGGVYVGSSTELVHLRDTDGDGRADQRTVLFRGFGTGDTHQTINSFSWGPSGELLFSQGLHAESRIETPWGVEELSHAGVWRLWPLQRRLEPFWSGAMGAHNPFGNVFDRWGQPFVFAGNGHGVYHLTQAMIPTAHFLEQRSIWNQGRKFGGGDVVDNSHWPAGNQGEFISGGYLQNTVERFRMIPEGSSFRAERLPPLIESTNTAFRIVDARFGPDGALYLCDWFNPIIGHYQASFRHPDRDRAHGRIWRVTAQGRALVAWKPLRGRSVRLLLDELVSVERWNRQMAFRELADRQTAAVIPELRTWLERMPSNDPNRDAARFAAVGLAAALESVEPALLTEASRSSSPEVRAFAARTAGHWADRLALPLEFLGRLAADPHPRVRLEAVVACAYVPDAHAVETACIVADQPMDSSIEYALTQCIQHQRGAWEPLRDRGGLTFGGNAGRVNLFHRLEGGAESARFAAGRLRRIAEVALEESTIATLSQTIAERGGGNEMTALLPVRSFTVGTRYLAAQHGAALAMAVEASRIRGVRPEPAAAQGILPLLESREPVVQGWAAALAGAWKVDAARARVEALAAGAEVQESVRRLALGGLASYGDENAGRILESLASSAPSTATRVDATAAWVRLDPVRAATWTAALLAGRLDPESVRHLVRTFLSHQGAVPALFPALNTKAPSADNAKLALRELAASGRRDPSLASVLSRAAGLDHESKPLDAPALAAFVREVRERGNPEAGAAVFRRPELGCTTCHSVDGTPGKIGPDLGALGTAQTVEYIVGAILEPQREVKEGFMAHEIITREGDTFQGYVRGETPQEVQLWDHLSLRLVRLSPDRIASRRPLGSLMPSGLATMLTGDEFRDLVRYLSGLGRQSGTARP
jgi:putative heme-binding domain-containing protein